MWTADTLPGRLTEMTCINSNNYIHHCKRKKNGAKL